MATREEKEGNWTMHVERGRYKLRQADRQDTGKMRHENNMHRFVISSSSTSLLKHRHQYEFRFLFFS